MMLETCGKTYGKTSIKYGYFTAEKALNTDLSVFTSFLPTPISIVSVYMNCQQYTTKTITLLSSRSKSSCGTH